jgi:hypothetical protein
VKVFLEKQTPKIRHKNKFMKLFLFSISATAKLYFLYIKKPQIPTKKMKYWDETFPLKNSIFTSEISIFFHFHSMRSRSIFNHSDFSFNWIKQQERKNGKLTLLWCSQKNKKEKMNTKKSCFEMKILWFFLVFIRGGNGVWIIKIGILIFLVF